MVAITTYRRNGEGVATPVNLLMVDGKAYVYTAAERGKAKRIRNNPQVLLAPSTYGSKVSGPAHAGTARIMAPEETHRSRPLSAASSPSATASRPSGSA